MIIFHEGMPGSGKSFAAMKDHIIPALKAGRKVWARMNGLDHKKIAEVAQIEQEKVMELLREIPPDQVMETFAVKNEEWKIPPDTLVVLDELQNFYPQKRNALDAETTKFIAEHRHRGIDVVAMGQLLKDCHRTWVNRVNRKIQFLNKDVVGKPHEYKWKLFNGHPDSKGQVVFTETSSGSSPYDALYFGTYKSYLDDTHNTERLPDERANIFKTAMFRRYLPAFAGVVLLAVAYLLYLFTGGLAPDQKQEQRKGTPSAPTKTEYYENGRLVKTEAVPADYQTATTRPAQEGQAIEDTWPDLITELAKDNRPRLAYALRSAVTTRISVEFRDSANQIKDQLSHEQIKNLGWAVMVSDDLKMASLSRAGKRIIVTAWPIHEPVAKASQSIQEQIRAESNRDLKSQDHDTELRQVASFKAN